MRQFIIKNRKNIFVRALTSGWILSLFLYLIVRTLFFEFPLSAFEEIAFFFKLTCIGSLLIASATTGLALIHNFFQSIKDNKNRVTL